MAAADDITYHLVTLTPAPPGLCRVRQQDNGPTDSFAEGERVAMVAGLQCTDGTGGTWPTVVLLTADELAPEVVGEYLELRGAPGVSTHTCADQDELSSHVRAAAWSMCDGDAPPTTTTPVNPPTRTAHYPACLVHPDQPRTPAASPAAERPATRATTSVPADQVELPTWAATWAYT